MTRELAWKPRWAVIMFVNVCARSTLDISIAPAVVSRGRPRPACRGLGAGVRGRHPAVAAGALEAGGVRERGQRDVAGGDAGAAAGVDVGHAAVLVDRDARRAGRDLDRSVVVRRRAGPVVRRRRSGRPAWPGSPR